MTTGRWEQVRAIFQDALEHSDEGRAAFLSTACEGDVNIRHEVESLLAAHVAAGEFLETPAVRLAADRTVVPAMQPGDRIGGFEIVGVLGSGGMGEVYRARDATLQRDVAIKVLPRAVAADPHRVARFERESRILASLNHPNIAAIHSVAQVGDLRLLILELVEGPTLADRLRTGPLSSSEALDVARELASALEAAHERGVIHRDVKPANVKLISPSGIKLLDFGLAKEHAPTDIARDAAVSDGTIDGVILGTCAYMSPEQARGKPTDRRTDVWAFGCVLFEMLSGTRAFDGDTTSDAIAAVLEHEPDWSHLPAGTATGIRRLLRRCLEKDPHQRLHDIADARIEIEDALADRDQPPIRRSHHTRALAFAILLALGAGALAYQWWRQATVPKDQPTNRTTRFTWALPGDLGLDSPPTVSPDGQAIAFTARARSGGPSKLYVRPLDQLEAHPVAGTDGAKQPFWSPDSRTLGYFARGKLMKVALDQGAPVELCNATDGRGGAWSANWRHRLLTLPARVRPDAGVRARRHASAGHVARRRAGRDRAPLAGVPARWSSLPLLRPRAQRGATRRVSRTDWASGLDTRTTPVPVGVRSHLRATRWRGTRRAARRSQAGASRRARSTRAGGW